jgi:hypothetical protein
MRAASQDFCTQGRRPETKVVALQIQAISALPQPVCPKPARAQERAHGGIDSSCAETREAVKPVAIAMTVDAFILIVLGY